MTFHPIVCMNVLAKIEKVFVSVVPSLNIFIIICYESNIWLFAFYESSRYHSNKNGCFSCFSCSQQWYFFAEVKKSVVSVVSVLSRDLLSCSEACSENGLQCNRVRQARSNMANLYERKIEEDKTEDSML